MQYFWAITSQKNIWNFGKWHKVLMNISFEEVSLKIENARILLLFFFFALRIENWHEYVIWSTQNGKFSGDYFATIEQWGRIVEAVSNDGWSGGHRGCGEVVLWMLCTYTGADTGHEHGTTSFREFQVISRIRNSRSDRKTGGRNTRADLRYPGFILLKKAIYIPHNPSI